MFNSALIYELAVLKVYAEPLLFAIDSSCPEYEEAKRLLKILDYTLPVPGESIGPNSILRGVYGRGMLWRMRDMTEKACKSKREL